MKKYFLFCLLPLLAACSSNEPKEAIIAGKINNFSGSIAYLTATSEVDTLKLVEGAFVYKKLVEKPQMVTLRIARQRISMYLIPGDSTFVEFNLSNPTPVFSGDNAIAQTHIGIYNDHMNKVMEKWRNVYALGISEFNACIDSIQNSLIVALDSAKNETKGLIDLEKARIKYGLLGMRMRYPEMNAYLSQSELNPDEVDYSMLDSFNPNIAEHLMFNDYSSIVNQYVNYKLGRIDAYKQVMGAEAEVRLPIQFKLIDSVIISDPTIRDYVKMNILDEEITYGKFYKLGDVVKSFVEGCSIPSYANKVNDKFNKMMALAPGNEAPAIEAQNIKGQTVTIESFRGNLVYVDFWATWCGPCRGELPYLEKLQSDYKGKKIVFVSLSIDDDKDAWQKMVEDKKMKGVQLHAKGAWNSDIAKSYKISGIPTFYLIGADGNIILPSAPRPSDENLRNIFDAELNKL